VIIHYGADPNGGKWEDKDEIPDAEWDAMTPDEREELLNDYTSNALAMSCDAWAYVEED
jgi:hypothetical protein